MTVADMTLIWVVVSSAIIGGLLVMGLKMVLKGQDRTWNKLMGLETRVLGMRDQMEDFDSRLRTFQGRHTMDVDRILADLRALHRESLVNPVTGRVVVPEAPSEDLQRLWAGTPADTPQPRTRYERLTDEDDLGL